MKKKNVKLGGWTLTLEIPRRSFSIFCPISLRWYFFFWYWYFSSLRSLPSLQRKFYACVVRRDSYMNIDIGETFFNLVCSVLRDLWTIEWWISVIEQAHIKLRSIFNLFHYNFLRDEFIKREIIIFYIFKKNYILCYRKIVLKYAI